MLGPLSGLLTPLGYRPGSVYVLRDNFSVDESGPMASPHTCDIAGTLTLVQTAANFSASSGALNFTSHASAFTAYTLRDTLSRSRANGMGVIADVNFSTRGAFVLGWNRGISIIDSAMDMAFGVSGNSFFPVISGNYQTGGTTLSTGVVYTIAVVMFASRTVLITNGGVLGSSPTIQWISDLVNSSPTAAMANKGGVGTLDNFREFSFGGSFGSDFGICDSYTASPANPTSGTQQADGWVEFTWTPASSEVLELDVRRTDANNRWIVRCDQAAGTIKLIERNASTETQRATASQTWTVGTPLRILVKCSGTTITVWVGLNSKNAYASASFNQSATGINVAGHSTGANLAAWPMTVTLPSL